MEKLHCLRMIFVWMAIASQIRSHSAADRIKPRRPVAVIGNKKVKLAVAIVVNPRRSDRPDSPLLQNLQPSRFGYIGKGSVAVVSIESIPISSILLLKLWQCSPIYTVDIGPAIAVIVNDPEPP